MKNVLIYVSPNKKFNAEDNTLVKIQIDNSLDLGWKKSDILLLTDFPFSYNGVTSHVLTKDTYYPFDLNASKIPALLELFTDGSIKKNEIYWCHDLDAYENFRITESELGLHNVDVGFTHYFYKPEWMGSSFFFKKSAQDICELLDETIRKRRYRGRNNEKNLTWLIDSNKISTNRIKKMNVTYNIMKRCLRTIYVQANKPLKVLHFRPSNYDTLMPDTALNMFMYGKNSLHKPLMDDRLIHIFHHHGLK